MHPSVSDPQVLEEFSCGHRKGGAPPSSMGKVGNFFQIDFLAGEDGSHPQNFGAAMRYHEVKLDDDLNKIPRKISWSFMNTLFLFSLNVCVSRHKNKTCFIVLTPQIKILRDTDLLIYIQLLIDTKKQFFLVLTTQAISTQIIKHIHYIRIIQIRISIYASQKNTYIYIYIYISYICMPYIYIYI